ncbi:NAD(P)-binding protein [Fluviispira vulneris]|uniref:NAD(P)-binding protein n=1 Tax=Fluviispira vulneris TaxID=2763012 RepID=UPI0016480D43|nr:NAD(P)-binding protein [Fluviispira vulneris]
MDTETSETIDNLVIGLGAAGIATAKLLSLSNPNEKNLALEHHFEPGGCASYFARGNPRRLFDVGATQLVECEKNEIQYNLLNLGQIHEESGFKNHKIEYITFHFSEYNIKLILNTNGDIKVTEGNIDEIELKNLIRFFKFTNKNSIYLWSLLKNIPKFPIISKKEFFESISMFFSLNFLAQIKIIFTVFLKTSTIVSLFGIKEEHVISHKVINSLLIDTAQTDMENTPWIVGCMGLSILHKGIYRLDGGMRSYFKNMSTQISKRKMHVIYAQEVKEITHFDDGYFIKTIDRNKIQKNYVVRDNLFVNTSIWNVVKLFNEDPFLYNHKIFKKWKEKSEESQGWGALALYGYFNDDLAYPREPWYHQLFPDKTEEAELSSSLYLSIYQHEHDSKIRCFTATVHIEISLFKPTKKTIYLEQLKKRIENAVNLQIIDCEIATPFTFEKYTLRNRGQVGGLIANFKNFLFKPTPSMIYHYNNKSTLYLIGDCVFPGQGVISSTLSGIIAWERATGHKFKHFIKGLY